jgi:hypothetical protein
VNLFTASVYIAKVGVGCMSTVSSSFHIATPIYSPPIRHAPLTLATTPFRKRSLRYGPQALLLREALDCGLRFQVKLGIPDPHNP